MNLLTNDLARLLHSMTFLVPRGDRDVRRSYIVRSRGADSPGGNLHSGAVEKSAVDGVAYVHVAITFAVSSDVANRREARAQRGLRVPDGHQRPGFLGGGHAGAVAEAAVNMGMRINQA